METGMHRHLLILACFVLLLSTFLGCSDGCEETRAGENTQLRIQSKLSDSLRPKLQIGLFADVGTLRVHLPERWRDTTIPISWEYANYPIRAAAIVRVNAIIDSIVISSDSSYSILWIDTLKPNEKRDSLPINGKNYTMEYESHLTRCF